MKWEYHCEEMVYETDWGTASTLNQLGADGWELVSVVDTGNVETDTGLSYFAFMFKRPKATKYEAAPYPAKEEEKSNAS